jgi:hypothetical protein
LDAGQATVVDMMCAPAVSLDADGRLRVAAAPTTKATPCRYLGKEIKRFDASAARGLDPDRSYRLHRPIEELRRVLRRFNNIPVVADHESDRVIGVVGDSAVIDGAFVRNDLVIWDQSAIDAIRTGEMRDISASYALGVDMSPGFHNGERYDGRMHSLRPHHIALVRVGRVKDCTIELGNQKPPAKLVVFDWSNLRNRFYEQAFCFVCPECVGGLY